MRPMRTRRTDLLRFATTLLALSMGAAASETPRIEVGKPFPDIALPAMEDGRPRSVSEFRGQKLALHIWASW